MAKFLNLLPWRRRRLEQDLDRELRYHVDRRVDDLRRSGLSDAEARRQAALEFGGVVQVQEEVRETWIWRWLDELSRDSATPAACCVAAPASPPPPCSRSRSASAPTRRSSRSSIRCFCAAAGERARASRPAGLEGQSAVDSWGGGNLMSYPLCRDLQEQERFFDGVFCRHPTSVNFSTGQQHEPVRAEIVSGSYFPVLGVRPALGRLIDPSDDLQPGAHPVVVLSHDTGRTVSAARRTWSGARSWSTTIR